MNYEERKQEVCKRCVGFSECPYVMRNLQYKCPELGATMQGWVLGANDIIEKACEFLYGKIDEITYFDDVNITELNDKCKFITDFKNAMMEE